MFTGCVLSLAPIIHYTTLKQLPFLDCNCLMLILLVILTVVSMYYLEKCSCSFFRFFLGALGERFLVSLFSVLRARLQSRS